MKMPKIGKIGRSAACILLVLAVFVLYELRLVQWQLVQGEEFEQISLSGRTDTIEMEAARGESWTAMGKSWRGTALVTTLSTMPWTWITPPATPPSSK